MMGRIKQWFVDMRINLAMWLIGKHTVAKNLTVRDGALEWPSGSGYLVNVRVFNEPRPIYPFTCGADFEFQVSQAPNP